MWFLWLQILFLLLLAALCGAGLAYWWLRGRYEDVTEAYSDFVKGAGKGPDLMPREELEAQLAALSAKLEKLENTDLSPLQLQLSTLADQLPGLSTDVQPVLEEIQALGSDVQRAQVDTSTVDERLSAIEASLSSIMASDDQIEALGNRLHAFEGELTKSINVAMNDVGQKVSEAPHVDPADLDEKLAGLRAGLQRMAAIGPEVGKLAARSSEFEKTVSGSLLAAISKLDQKLSALRNTDLSPVHQELTVIKEQLPALSQGLQPIASQLQALDRKVMTSQGDLAPLDDKLTGIAAKVAPNASNHDAIALLSKKLGAYSQSIEAMQQRFVQIESRLSALGQQIDQSPLKTTIDEVAANVSALQPDLAALKTLQPLESSLAHVREMVFNLRERDLSTLNEGVRAIEARVDFVGVENRLTSIEYGLAATHHMLRSRLVQNAEMPPPPRREPFKTPSDIPFTPDMPQSKPKSPLDPLDIIRSPGERGNLILEAGFGKADDLEQIRGIGPMLRQLLHDIGVFYFWQIASWSDEDVAYIDDKLPGYHGRISRDNWVEQAAELAALPSTAIRPQAFGADV